MTITQRRRCAAIASWGLLALLGISVLMFSKVSWSEGDIGIIVLFVFVLTPALSISCLVSSFIAIRYGHWPAWVPFIVCAAAAVYTGLLYVGFFSS